MELSDRILNEIEWLEQDLMWWEEAGCGECGEAAADVCLLKDSQFKERAKCVADKEEALRKEIGRLRETGQLADSEELEAKHGQGRLF